MPKRVVGRVFLLSGVVLTAAAPVTLDGDGVRVREAACQDGTCCAEEKSTCVVGTHAEPNYYYKPQGSCKPVSQT